MTERRLRTVITVLSVLGIGVAGYLVYVHYADIKPICASGGGGCEKVQASDQSKLLGVPVALLGLGAYITLFVTSLVDAEWARMLGALTALIGVGFSAYLTYESVFSIEATCQWCLTSAALMVALAITCTWRLLKAP
ncbi:MAG: vitamin K epoxide reductase family protein [Solirubrobacteraceae bacterium]|nr:vitamin K epoxide reductase family protein [Solirubrobacteraceae bacterium]